MSGTVKSNEKFLAAFGYVADDTAGKRKDEVLRRITRFEQEVAKLPVTTGTVKPHEILTDELHNLKTKVNAVAGKTPAAKLQYKQYVELEKEVEAVGKKITAQVKAEEHLAKLKDLDPKAIDALVRAKGNKVASADDQGFLIAAIRARFKIDQMSGDLSSNALPRFYKALSIVPEEHARLNPKLQYIKRSKGTDDSSYTGGVIDINAGETGPWKSDRLKYSNSAGKALKLDHFDAHTLHEVGHAVDDSAKFMDGKRGDAAFGGWEESTAEEVRGIMLQRLQKNWGKRLDAETLKMLANTALTGSFKAGIDILRKNQERSASISKSEVLAHPAIKEADKRLKKVLEDFADRLDSQEASAALMTGYKQQELLGMLRDEPQLRKLFLTQMINDMRRTKTRAAELAAERCGDENAGPPVPDQKVLDEIEKDPAFELAAAMQKDFWFAGSSVIEASAWNNYIYHKDKRWWKYPAAARHAMVNPYQFRSPSEWFAEVYTVHMLGKLPKSHPASAVINGIKPTQAG